MNPISASSAFPASSIASTTQASPAARTAQGAEKSGFSDLVGQFVEQTNSSQLDSTQSITDLVEGRTDNIQQVVLAVANAELSFQFFMEVRNKLIDSYNELMRMQF